MINIMNEMRIFNKSLCSDTIYEWERNSNCILIVRNRNGHYHIIHKKNKNGYWHIIMLITPQWS
jgi:hypothetical protein